MSEEIEKRVARLRAANSLEERAYDAHLSIWNRKKELFSGCVPSHPLDLLEPAVALHLNGYEVRTDPDLGEMWDAGRHVRVAGIVDQRRKLVRISPVLNDSERRFTTAHELAHVICHPNMTGLHRDRAVSGPSSRREYREQEADSFSSCFLMPAKLVLQRFKQCYGADLFRVDEDAVFGLRLGSIDQAKKFFRCQRDVSLAVAKAPSFMGVSFDALHKFFRVSPIAMAIRLEELGLIDESSLRKAW